MEDATIVNQIVTYIPSIDFSQSHDDGLVSLFETTIRYLAGAFKRSKENELANNGQCRHAFRL